MKYHQVLVIGGGWAGVSAALAAKLAGADVALCERTDMLLGTGLVGGIMRNNGRFVATEEACAMGFGHIFKITDSLSTHRNVDFPGHKHASFYNVLLIEPEVRRFLKAQGITLYFRARINNIKITGGKILSITSDENQTCHGEAFVDTTGSSGPMGMCRMFGNGCACCIQRCPAFGPRVSLSSLAGLPEFMCTRLKHTYGAMSGSCKVYKESLSKTIREELEAKGVVIIPIPEKLRNIEKLGAKVCQQYALPAYADSVIILDTGHAKLMSPYFPLEELRSIEGMENVRFADPLGGGKGNSIRLTAISPRDNTLKAIGADNLFLAGERAGVLVGHTEAIVTGSLAGHNAALYAMGKGLKTIPASLAIGDIIDQSRVDCQGLPAVPGGFGLNASHTFSGSIYFKRMEDLGFYSPDPEVIHNKVKKLGLDDFFCA